MSTDEFRAVTKHLRDKDKCQNCGHEGSMHSDGVNYTHTGECFTEIGIGDDGKSIWCDCKKFVPLGDKE